MEDALEVLLGVDVGAGGDECAAGELLLEVGVLAPVQLVDRQLPHRVRPRRAVLGTIGRNKRRYWRKGFGHTIDNVEILAEYPVVFITGLNF